ncbi:MAG: cupin domain-containing protein, partial [Bacteroidaceae bacterium]
MIKKEHAEYWITRLKMASHPEGGYFREEYRAEKS